VAAAAYLLCRFDSLHELGRYNFLFYGLAIRVFGRKRIRSLFAELEAMLVEWAIATELRESTFPARCAKFWLPIGVLTLKTSRLSCSKKFSKGDRRRQHALPRSCVEGPGTRKIIWLPSCVCSAAASDPIC